MSSLVPDPNQGGSPVRQNTQDNSELYFRELIEQQKQLLTSNTDIDEYSKRLDLINKTLDLVQKDKSFQREDEQQQIKIEVAKIELIDRQAKSNELKLQTKFRIIASPIFIIAGLYFLYYSNSFSFVGPGLLYLGLRLVFLNEDITKGLTVIKDFIPK